MCVCVCVYFQLCTVYVYLFTDELEACEDDYTDQKGAQNDTKSS